MLFFKPGIRESFQSYSTKTTLMTIGCRCTNHTTLGAGLIEMNNEKSAFLHSSAAALWFVASVFCMPFRTRCEGISIERLMAQSLVLGDSPELQLLRG